MFRFVSFISSCPGMGLLILCVFISSLFSCSREDKMEQKQNVSMVIDSRKDC